MKNEEVKKIKNAGKYSFSSVGLAYATYRILTIYRPEIDGFEGEFLLFLTFTYNMLLSLINYLKNIIPKLINKKINE